MAGPKFVKYMVPVVEALQELGNSGTPSEVRDIIAKNPHTDEIMGISVKTRSRAEGTDVEGVYIQNGDFQKVEDACKAFGCVPYFSIIVDAGETIRAYVLSTEHLLEICPKGKLVCNWKMRDKELSKYEQDPEIKSFMFNSRMSRWWEDTSDE